MYSQTVLPYLQIDIIDRKSTAPFVYRIHPVYPRIAQFNIPATYQYICGHCRIEANVEVLRTARQIYHLLILVLTPFLAGIFFSFCKPISARLSGYEWFDDGRDQFILYLFISSFKMRKQIFLHL